MPNLKEVAKAIQGRLGGNHHEDPSLNGYMDTWIAIHALPSERAKIEELQRRAEALATRLNPYSEIRSPGLAKLRISQEVNSCLPKEPKPLSNWLGNPIPPNHGLTMTVQTSDLPEGARKCSITIGVELLPPDPETNAEKPLEERFTGSGVTAESYINFSYCGATTFAEKGNCTNPKLLTRVRDLDPKLVLAKLIDFGNKLVDAKEFGLKQADGEAVATNPSSRLILVFAYFAAAFVV